MSELSKKLKRIAELGTELEKIINTDSTLIAVRTEWDGIAPKKIALHVSADNYETLKVEHSLNWKLESIGNEFNHFGADFEGIKLLMLFDDKDLPEELKDQVEAMKKAQSAATDKAED